MVNNLEKKKVVVGSQKIIQSHLPFSLAGMCRRLGAGVRGC